MLPHFLGLSEMLTDTVMLEYNKTCRQTGKLTCNCTFPLWSILESYIYSYQTWFKSIKGFAETDTVKIKHKIFKVRDLDLKAM